MQAAAAVPWKMKTLPVLRGHLCDPTRLAAAASSFHSTPASFAKWKNKWDCPKSEKGARKASRSYERMEAQEALLILMKFHGSKPSGKDLRVTGRRSLGKEYTIIERLVLRQTLLLADKKDKERFCNFFHEEHYVHPDEIFEAIFGAHHGFTWSRISWEDFRFRDRSFRFRWGGGESQRERIPSDSEDESEEETTRVGSHAHRAILGLPPCGPLTLEDVKTAFRESAMRWHPDRHPGSSQAVAEEKFKLCVNAYNSLCSILKAA
nr:unnamed protein product [Digitaria exilis]